MVKIKIKPKLFRVKLRKAESQKWKIERIGNDGYSKLISGLNNNLLWTFEKCK